MVAVHLTPNLKMLKNNRVKLNAIGYYYCLCKEPESGIISLIYHIDDEAGCLQSLKVFISS